MLNAIPDHVRASQDELTTGSHDIHAAPELGL
jgi:hypothetical protein